MGPDIRFREATLSDVDDIRKLFEQTIERVCRNDYDDRQREVWKKNASEERWQKAIEIQFFLVAEIGGEIVGFGSLLDNSHIDFLFTSSGYLRRGVAAQILERLLKKASQAGASHVSSEVSKTAVPFFVAQGFSLVRPNRKTIEEVPIDNFQMEKRLL